MKALLYLSVRGFINRLKARARKPLSYVALVGIGLYVLMMYNSFNIIFSDMGIMGPEGYALLLSFFTVWTIPANLLTYARKRGLTFKHCDVHFVFSAPIDPKKILLYAQIKTLYMGLFLNLLMSVGGVIWFHVPAVKMALFFLVTFVVENILEAALMLIVFGNEFLGEKGTKVLQGGVWACVGAMLLLLLSQLLTKPLSFSLIGDMLSDPLLQLVPLIGWNIAFIRLLLIGPDTLNLICGALYLAAAVLLPLVAWRMKCTGEYFEDAMTFADEYEAAIRRKKSGSAEGDARKRKYKKAEVVYKGGGARAIYYRQLLEYKKNRFFLLNYNSFILLGIGLLAAGAKAFGADLFSFAEESSELAVFILPGVSAYMVFIFSSIAPKWSQELKNPYTFLLPDTPMRKLWYSTLLEHVKAALDGALLCVPLGAALGISPVQIVLCILIYACLQANRLYISMVCDGILKPLFGSFGLTLIRMMAQAAIMLLGVLAAVIGTGAAGVEIGFAAMILVAVLFAGLLALFASILFGRMESLENY